MPCVGRRVSKRASHCLSNAVYRRFSGSPLLGQNLRRFGWRVREVVGHEIRDARVHFMADPGDDWNARQKDGAPDAFFVEAPKIFERSAPPGEENDISAAEGGVSFT